MMNPEATLLMGLLHGILRMMGYDAAPLPNDPVLARAAVSAQTIVRVVERVVPSPVEQKAWTRILFTFGGFESGWWKSPKGWNDNGNACGVLQVHTPQKYVPGATCDKVRKDLELGYEVGLRLMLQLEEHCGSKASALTAYATGVCGTSTFVLPLVKRRCKVAGLTAECRLPGA
jgi:hypothetical protein